MKLRADLLLSTALRMSDAEMRESVRALWRFAFAMVQPVGTTRNRNLMCECVGRRGQQPGCPWHGTHAHGMAF